MTVYKDFELNETMINMLEHYSCDFSKSIMFRRAGRSILGKEVSFFVDHQTGTCRFVGSGIDESFMIGDVVDAVVRTMTEDDTDLSLYEPLHNHKELASALGLTDTRLIRKYIYKDYECGPWITLSDGKVSLGSIVEGSDVEIGPFDLKYPIYLMELHRTLEAINNIVQEEWEE
jgi:hypothetical protein